MNYPEPLVDDIDSALKKSKDILIEDIRFYPQYRDFFWEDEKLVEIMKLNVSELKGKMISVSKARPEKTNRKMGRR